MKRGAAQAVDVQVFLPPRALGGHEAALLGWLADAVLRCGLRADIVAADAALLRALRAAGLGSSCQRWSLVPGEHLPAGWRGLLQRSAGPSLLRRCAALALLSRLASAPRHTPVLLAPGCLHAAAWLLAAAVLLRHRVWVYVPMTHTARAMGFPGAGWRDLLLRPWLRGVEAWITPSREQARQLHSAWGVQAPVHVLPNMARLPACLPAGVPACVPACQTASLRATPAPFDAPQPAAAALLRVSWVGRFDLHQKGLDWLAAQLQSDTWLTARCHWRFQGPGSDTPVFQALARHWGPARVQVHPPGPVDAALQACDVMLLCSRFEGVPLVALEAVARGRPVVATRQSGLGDGLHPDCLFDFGDVRGLQRALQRMASPAARQAAVEHATLRLGPDARRAAYQRALAVACQALRAAPQRVAP